MNNKFVLHDGDRWFYYLGTPHDVIFYADGEPVQEAQVRGWYFTTKEASVIEVERRPRKERAQYHLMEGVTTFTQFPSGLTVHQFDDRNNEESPNWDPRVAALYEPVYRELPAEREVVDAKWVRLEGAPPPRDGLEWRAELPFELRHAPEYRHLFPGRLEGFHSHLKERLNQLPNVNAYDSGGFKVYVKVAYEKPVIGRDLKGKRTTFTQKTQEVKINPPHVVPGMTRLGAKADWDRLMEEFVAEVTYWTTPQICAHCKGTGIVSPQLAEGPKRSAGRKGKP